MSMLDRQIASVRGKLTLGRYFSAMGFALAGFCGLVLVLILIDRFLWVDLPHAKLWFWSGIAVTAMLAGAVVLLRRPSAHEAAVLIDSTLGLNEKFSTALFARFQGDQDDPFVAAALIDAERSAGNVSLRGQFPIAFPRSGFLAIGSAVGVLLIAWLVPRVDLFEHHAKQAVVQKQVADRVAAVQAAQQALASVSAMPASVQSQQKVELAKKELQQALDQNVNDPSVLKLTTRKAEEEAEAAKREEMKSNPQYAQAMADKAVFNALNPSTDDQGPVADAIKEMGNGDFSKAADELQAIPDKFDRMTPEEQSKATEQMKNTADQLEKIANDPAPMQAAQQQVKQNGATTQQSQAMTQAAQQAAQGNKQAQQNLQQMQKQVAQQNSGQKPPTPQQQQQMQKAAQQMQSVANSQSKAQQMARAAKQMVHGMEMAQAQKQGGSQGGKEQANAQTGNSEKSGPLQGGQTPSGQQGGTQQTNASKPGGQAPGGNQPGQAAGAGQSQSGGQEQMQQAAGQMAQTLSQMDQTQSGGQQLASGNQPSNKPGGGNNGGGAKQGPNGKGSNPGPSGGSAAGTTGTGSLNGNPNLNGLTPLTISREMVPTQNIPSGRILAKSYVKADPIIGKSTIQLSPEAKSAVKESTDEVSEDTVPKDAEQAVKDYFDTVQDNSGK